jgi:hypothetical protein
MFPSYRLINQIKRAAGGRVGNQGLRRSLEMLEAANPIGALMATLAVDGFKPTMLDVARDRPESEVLAWMTVAASGPDRPRRALAARATEILSPQTLLEVLTGRGEFRDRCAVAAEAASSEEEWGALQLLGQLRHSDVRRIAEREPSLRRRLREARSGSKRWSIPPLQAQLRELGLVAAPTGAS